MRWTVWPGLAGALLIWLFLPAGPTLAAPALQDGTPGPPGLVFPDDRPGEEWYAPALRLAETQPPSGVSAPPAGATPSSPGGVASVVTSISQVFHIIRFPFETMTDAVVKMSAKITREAYVGAGGVYGAAVDRMIFGSYGVAPEIGGGTATPLFTDFIRPHWSITLSLALLFLPATLALTAVSAMRAGTTSVLGYADLKEAILGWLISAGFAGASFYLLGLAHRVSLLTARALLAADFGRPVTGDVLAGAFFNGAALAVIAVTATPLALYISFFALFLSTSVLLGLGLALAAYTALVYMLAVIAPVVIVLGALPPLRWLHSLWLKMLTIAFLIPPIDALLLRAAVSLHNSALAAEGQGAIGSFITGLFITAGVISALITVNFKLGEMIFGALGEVHRRAWESTQGVMNMVTTAAGAAAGFGLAASFVGSGGAGLLGGGRPLPSPMGGAMSVPAESASGGAGGGGNGEDGQGTDAPWRVSSTNGATSAAPLLTGDPALGRRAAHLAQSAGHALAMGTRHPLVRGLGLGGMLGGAYAGAQAEASSGVQVESASERWSQLEYDRMLNRAGDIGYPDALMRPGFIVGQRLNARGLLGRHLQRQAPEAAPEAAAALNTALFDGLTRSSNAANPIAAQELYDVYAHENASPARLAAGLERWAGTFNVSLPPGWRAQVDRMFGVLNETPSSRLPTPNSQSRMGVGRSA